jgi:hypothetical protein
VTLLERDPLPALAGSEEAFATERRGAPQAHQTHALGDAHTCTNPLYGRGCSLALVQAVLLADASAAHPGDPVGRATAYEAARAREVEPWFDLAVQTDEMGADPTGCAGAGENGGGRSINPRGKALAAVFAAGATDPVIGGALARLWTLLDTPATLASKPEVVARMAAVMADPDAHPPPPRIGPPARTCSPSSTTRGHHPCLTRPGPTSAGAPSPVTASS